MIRSLFILLSTIAALHVISSVHSILFLNEFLGLGTLALAHIYRFQYAGRYCACRIGNQCNEGVYGNQNFTNHLFNDNSFIPGFAQGGLFGNGYFNPGNGVNGTNGNVSNGTN